MAGHSSLESSGLTAEETTTTASTSTAVGAISSPGCCETMLWEGWSTSPNPYSTTTTGDEASTSNALQPLIPELAATTTTSAISHCLSFYQQSEMLSTMLSSFHPPADQHPQNSDDNVGTTFLDDSEGAATTVSFDEKSKSLTYLSGIPACPLPSRRENHLYPFLSAITLSPWQSLGPDSHEFMKWDAGSPINPVHVPWPGTTPTIQLPRQLFNEDEKLQSAGHIRNMNSFALQAQITSKSKRELCNSSSFGNLGEYRNHSDLNPRGGNQSQNSMLSMPPSTAWTTESSSRDQRSSMIDSESSAQVQVNLGASRRGGIKHRQEQELPGGEELSNYGPSPKRLHLLDDHAGALWWNHDINKNSSGLWRVVDSASPCRSGGSPVPANSAASQAMELFAIGPALNTNGKPRARRGSATDPQSIYARNRREKINERLKILQHLVPNGSKVDIVTMLDEAVHYVQFLQLQVKLLKSDKYWIHATPNTYKGIDLTNPPTQM